MGITWSTLNPFSTQNTQNINFDPYGPVGALKQAGQTVGNELKGSILDPGRGNETLAAAYAAAQQQAAALSDLQWQRQMQGLQGALGHVGQQQSLWNSVYGGPPGGGAPAGPNLGSPPFTMPAPGGGQLRPDYITPGHAPNTNPDFQSILDRLNAAGGPQGRATTENTFGSPNPAGSPPGTTWQMPSAHTSNPMVTSASGGGGGVASSASPASPGGGISMQQGALSAPPPPLTYGTPRPTPIAATASRGLDSYLSPPPAPTPQLAIAAPNLSSFAAPPPPAPASAALPGLADFIPVTGGGMSPMLRKVGWGGL